MLYLSPYTWKLPLPLLLFLIPQAWNYCDQYGKFIALERCLKVVVKSLWELVSSGPHKRCTLEGKEVENISQAPGNVLVLISSFIFLDLGISVKSSKQPY